MGFRSSFAIAATDPPGITDDHPNPLRSRPLQDHRRALPGGPSTVFAAVDPPRRAVLRTRRLAPASGPRLRAGATVTGVFVVGRLGAPARPRTRNAARRRPPGRGEWAGHA